MKSSKMKLPAALAVARALHDRTKLRPRAATGGEAAIYVYERIGGYSWDDSRPPVTASGVARELEAARAAGAKTVNVYVNSPGGDVFEAKAIYSQLRRFAEEAGARIVVHVDGLAASAASFIAMAGDRIITGASGTWMVHRAWGIALGNAPAVRGYADLLDKMDADMAAIYAARTKRDLAAVLAVMDAETWMSASEALEAGFSDEVLPLSVGEGAPEEEDEEEEETPAEEDEPSEDEEDEEDDEQGQAAAALLDKMAARSLAALMAARTNTTRRTT